MSPRLILKNTYEARELLGNRKFPESNDEIYAPEVPKEVFQLCCKKVGEMFVEDGFKYSGKELHMRRSVGDLCFQVAFLTSHHNVAGRHVSMTVSASVLSRRLKKWRSLYPLLNATDYVAGGQIGNLQVDECWITWELANPNERLNEIADIGLAIRELALPYFSLFEDRDRLIKLLMKDELPSMRIDSKVEFLMCFESASSARISCINYLKRNLDRVEVYRSRYESVSRGEVSSAVYASDMDKLALYSKIFEYGDLSIDAVEN